MKTLEGFLAAHQWTWEPSAVTLTDSRFNGVNSGQSIKGEPTSRQGTRYWRFCILLEIYKTNPPASINRPPTSPKPLTPATNPIPRTECGRQRSSSLSQARWSQSKSPLPRRILRRGKELTREQLLRLCGQEGPKARKRSGSEPSDTRHRRQRLLFMLDDRS